MGYYRASVINDGVKFLAELINAAPVLPETPSFYNMTCSNKPPIGKQKTCARPSGDILSTFRETAGTIRKFNVKADNTDIVNIRKALLNGGIVDR